MGRQSSYVRTDVAFSKFDKADTVVQQEISDMTMEVAEKAADKMREFIETRGTNRVWEGAWRSQKTGRYRTRSGPGRIDSGDMLKNVGVKFQRGEKQSRAVFGWVNQFENYYKFQELGFKHAFRNVTVPGMFALRDSRRYVVSKMPSITKKYEKRIARRLGS